MLLIRNHAALSLLSKQVRAGNLCMENRSFYSPAHRRLLKKRALVVEKRVVPTMDIALSMPLRESEMDNSSLLSLSAMGNHAARAEVLKRHIMCRDNVDYDKASETFKIMQTSNHRGMLVATIPYKLGIGAALTAGFGSIPLCFHLPSVHAFNIAFVTTDVPEPHDLETYLEVGSWAWNWMEPMLGQISFLLLCLQFSRAQLHNLGIRPFTSFVKAKRAERLCNEFPRYDPKVVSDYSVTDNFKASFLRRN